MPARPLPLPLDDGSPGWIPMCTQTHPLADGGSYLWMGLSTADRATTQANADLHNEAAHPAEREALF